MYLRNQFVGVSRDHDECAYPFAKCRVLPVLPQTADAEGHAVVQGEGIGLLCPLAPDRFPFKEAVERQNATTAAMVTPELPRQPPMSSVRAPKQA